MEINLIIGDCIYSINKQLNYISSNKKEINLQQIRNCKSENQFLNKKNTLHFEVLWQGKLIDVQNKLPGIDVQNCNIIIQKHSELSKFQQVEFKVYNKKNNNENKSTQLGWQRSNSGQEDWNTNSIIQFIVEATKNVKKVTKKTTDATPAPAPMTTTGTAPTTSTPSCCNYIQKKASNKSKEATTKATKKDNKKYVKK